MENNELMNMEEIEVMDDVVVVEEKSGISTGVAMIIGAGLTLAVSAGIKKLRKVIAERKAKKELHQPDHEILVEDEDIEDVVAV